MTEAEPAVEQDLSPPDDGRADKLVTAGPPAAQAGGVLTVDLAAIEANWRSLGHRVMPAECAAVIKADGYGCGIEKVAAALAKTGCKTFFVADLAEARQVRNVAPDPAIYVLNALLSGTAGSYADIRALPPRIRSENHGITLLMSHLACAERPERPLNERQISVFREVRMLYRGIPSSLANSSGIFLGQAAHCDMVRPGVALYGVNPAPAQRNPMRPVIELQARIAQVRTVPRGDTVGYDPAWTAKRTTRIAVVAVGYADGYLRAASASDEAPGADAIVAGPRCPLAGRVSMDLLAIDITDLPDNAARRGDLATLIRGGGAGGGPAR